MSNKIQPNKKKFLNKFLNNKFFKLKLPAKNRYEILFFNKDEFNNIMSKENIESDIKSDIKISTYNEKINAYTVIEKNPNLINELSNELSKINNKQTNTIITNSEIKNKYELLRKLSYFGMYFNYTNDKTLQKRFNRNQPFNYKFYNNSNFLYDQIKSSGKKLKSFIINKILSLCKKNKKKIIEGIRKNLEEQKNNTQQININNKKIEDSIDKILTKEFISLCLETIPKKIILDETDIKK